jgi:hypothetical protein
LVSERISSNSSLERKKNLGKDALFYSIKALSPLVTISKASKQSFKIFNYFLFNANSITLGAASDLIIMLFQLVSTSLNLPASTAKCLTISGEAKIGSK